MVGTERASGKAAASRSGEDVRLGMARLSLGRVFAGLGVFGAAIVLAAALALIAPAQMPPPGWAPGGGGGGSAATAWGAPAIFAGLPACDDDAPAYQALSNSVYEFTYCDGVARTYYRDGVELIPPPASGWTQENFESGDIEDHDSGSMYLNIQRSGIGEHTLVYRAITPSAPWGIEVLIESDLSGANAATGGGRDANAGIFLRESTGKLIKYSFGAFNNTIAVDVSYWDDFDTSNTPGVISESDSAGGLLHDFVYSHKKWLRVSLASDVIHFYYAIKKGEWRELGTGIDFDAHLTVAGPTHFGIGSYKGDSNALIDVIHLEVIEE